MDYMNCALSSHGQQIFRGICLPKLGMNLISAILSSYQVPNCISVCLILLKTLSFLSREEHESRWVGKPVPNSYIYRGRQMRPRVWAWDGSCQPSPFLTFCSIQETGQGICLGFPALQCVCSRYTLCLTQTTSCVPSAPTKLAGRQFRAPPLVCCERVGAACSLNRGKAHGRRQGQGQQ